MVFKKVHENPKNAMQCRCCCTEWRWTDKKKYKRMILIDQKMLKIMHMNNIDCFWMFNKKNRLFLAAIGCNSLIGECNSVLQWVNVTKTIAPSQSLWNVHRFFIISIKYINKLKLISSAWYTHNGAHFFFWFYFEALTACFEYTH